MSHVTLAKTEHGLRLTLTPEGRAELLARAVAGLSIDTNATFYALLDEHLKRGWDVVRHDEISAPGNAPMISDECFRYPDGRLEMIGVIYWHQRYQIESAAAELVRVGHVDFAVDYWPQY